MCYLRRCYGNDCAQTHQDKLIYKHNIIHLKKCQEIGGMRIKLIENLTTDISLQATYEMFEPMPYSETTGRCEDYTLSFAGPGDYFKSEAIAAQKRGIRLYSMTNTGV